MKCKQKILKNYKDIQIIDALRAQGEKIKQIEPDWIIEDFGFNIQEVYSYSASKDEIYLRMKNGDSHKLIYDNHLMAMLDIYFKRNDPVFINEIKMIGN